MTATSVSVIKMLWRSSFLFIVKQKAGPAEGFTSVLFVRIVAIFWYLKFYDYKYCSDIFSHGLFNF